MTTLFGIITFAIYAALIVGLIKPALIMRWSKKPTRLKILGLWLASFFIVPILAVILISDEDLTEDRIEIATTNIEKGKYTDAINSLSKIEEKDPLYGEGKRLLKTADSLYKIEEKEKQVALKLEEDKIAEEEKKSLFEQLERELKSVNKGVDFSTYRGTVDALQMELILFGTYAQIIKQGENSDDSKINELARQLKTKVVNMQIKEFPTLRKEYAKVVAKLMWEHDVEVFSSGKNNSYLNFTGGLFAANKNKQDFQEQLKDAPKMFRFSQTRYRWYKGDDEYTYYTTYEGKDSDLVDFK